MENKSKHCLKYCVHCNLSEAGFYAARAVKVPISVDKEIEIEMICKVGCSRLKELGLSWSNVDGQWYLGPDEE